MNRSTVKILLGAAVVALGVAGMVWSQRAQTVQMDGGYAVTARFGSADGIGTGTNVLLAGIKVGQVADISFDTERQRAVVTFWIRPGIEIPEDSVALIVSEGLLGVKYVKLQPGGALDMMQAGDEFEYVQDSISFEEILEKVILNAEQQRKQEEKEQQKQPRSPDEPTRLDAPGHAPSVFEPIKPIGIRLER